MTYDRNGNIKTLQRYGAVGLQDNLTYAYTGNRLANLTGTVNASYAYDSNGNMIADGRKGIGINYNLLNLPHEITRNSEMKATYAYLADGTKLAVMTDTVVELYTSRDGFDYLGSMVYKTLYSTRTLESTDSCR